MLENIIIQKAGKSNVINKKYYVSLINKINKNYYVRKCHYTKSG